MTASLVRAATWAVLCLCAATARADKPTRQPSRLKIALLPGWRESPNVDGPLTFTKDGHAHAAFMVSEPTDALEKLPSGGKQLGADVAYLAKLSHPNPPTTARFSLPEEHSNKRWRWARVTVTNTDPVDLYDVLVVATGPGGTYFYTLTGSIKEGTALLPDVEKMIANASVLSK